MRALLALAEATAVQPGLLALAEATTVQPGLLPALLEVARQHAQQPRRARALLPLAPG